MSTQIILPRIMQVGEGASQEISSVLASLSCQKPLIITDKVMVELGYVSRIKEALSKQNISCDVFDDTVPEPTIGSIMAGVDKVRNGNYDAIIAVGGGSPIDSAKAIAILGKYGGSMRDYKFPRIVNELGLPIIAIPTTAGTGSEATKFTIITDEANDEKMLCVGLGFMPVAALVDWLVARGENYSEAFVKREVIRAAVNQEYVQFDHPIKNSDEIAFFPPVTGG